MMGILRDVMVIKLDKQTIAVISILTGHAHTCDLVPHLSLVNN